MTTGQPAAMRPEWPGPPGPDAGFDEIKAYAQTMMMADFILSVGANDVDLPEESRPTPEQAWAMAKNYLHPKAPTLDLEQPIDRAFAAAKETCRIGHPPVGAGGGCSYGGMSPAYGYWLSDENCPLSHGDRCDLRAACDGAEAQTGFIGHDPDPDHAWWIWAVMACQSCADVWVASHPEWKKRKGSDD